ncbi:MAG: hypothetical protein NT049_05305 [Planctomycetota bacterium]|nr:hypothetical protein [Planctomycetota bacterium]
MNSRYKRSLIDALLALCVTVLSAGAAFSAQPGGTLSTSQGAAITSTELRQMVDSLVPGSAQGLLVATECYGGNLIGDFANKANTATASATSPGQQAIYDAFDYGAAAGMAPGAGKTGQTVYDAGTASKANSETPTSGGTLGLGAFSLENVAADGAVRSRHILVYAGKPDGGKNRDKDQRDKIKQNFAGQANTTVTTVGGDGTGGWDYAGSAKGLRSALLDIGARIAGSADPGKEQWIFFITDHGGQMPVTGVGATVNPGASHSITGALTLASADVGGTALNYGTTADSPGFGITISGITAAIDPENYTPHFHAGDWSLEVSDPAHPGNTVMLTQFSETYTEYDDNIIGDMAGEGITLVFPTTEANFESFFDVFADARMINNTGESYLVDSFFMTTGDVGKLPEPATLTLLAVGGLLALRRKKGPGPFFTSP